MPKPKDPGYKGSPYCACTSNAQCLLHYYYDIVQPLKEVAERVKRTA